MTTSTARGPRFDIGEMVGCMKQVEVSLATGKLRRDANVLLRLMWLPASHEFQLRWMRGAIAERKQIQTYPSTLTEKALVAFLEPIAEQFHAETA